MKNSEKIILFIMLALFVGVMVYWRSRFETPMIAGTEAAPADATPPTPVSNPLSYQMMWRPAAPVSMMWPASRPSVAASRGNNGDDQCQTCNSKNILH